MLLKKLCYYLLTNGIIYVHKYWVVIVFHSHLMNGIRMKSMVILDYEMWHAVTG